MLRILIGTAIGIALGFGWWGLIGPQLLLMLNGSSVQTACIELIRARTHAPEALAPSDVLPWALVRDPGLYLFDLVGTVAFGATGSLAALIVLRNTGGHNALALLAASLLTGVGGGTARCKLLGMTPLVLTQPEYFIAAISPGLVAALVPLALKRTERLWNYLDHLGVGVFAVIGARAALAAGMPHTVAVLCGALTAAGGGLLRDVVVLGRPPASFRRGAWYAEAAMITTIIYLCASSSMALAAAARVAAGVGFFLRLIGELALSRCVTTRELCMTRARQ